MSVFKNQVEEFNSLSESGKCLFHILYSSKVLSAIINDSEDEKNEFINFKYYEENSNYGYYNFKIAERNSDNNKLDVSYYVNGQISRSNEEEKLIYNITSAKDSADIKTCIDNSIRINDEYSFHELREFSDNRLNNVYAYLIFSSNERDSIDLTDNRLYYQYLNGEISLQDVCKKVLEKRPYTNVKK